jgi:hypothetical protein
MILESGGRAPQGVQTHEETLDPDQAERIEEWVHDLVMSRERRERRTA